jgi:hypothetical protein
VVGDVVHEGECLLVIEAEQFLGGGGVLLEVDLPEGPGSAWRR